MILLLFDTVAVTALCTGNEGAGGVTTLAYVYTGELITVEVVLGLIFGEDCLMVVLTLIRGDGVIAYVCF